MEAVWNFHNIISWHVVAYLQFFKIIDYYRYLRK